MWKIAQWWSKKRQHWAHDQQMMGEGMMAFTGEDSATMKRIEAHIVFSKSSRRVFDVDEDGKNAFTRFLFWFDARYPVFRPLSHNQLAYQALIVVCVVAALILMPYQLCVPYIGHKTNPWSTVELISGSLDCVLTLDIFVTFNVALLPRDGDMTEDLVTDRLSIFRAYVSTWFFPDLVSSFPVGSLPAPRKKECVL